MKHERSEKLLTLCEVKHITAVHVAVLYSINSEFECAVMCPSCYSTRQVQSSLAAVIQQSIRRYFAALIIACSLDLDVARSGYVYTPGIYYRQAGKRI